jgi:flavin reductase (DIM6/NTAB) family NADH-FMN oxidoreductase RutF
MNLQASVRLLAKPIPCWAPIGLAEGQRLIDVSVHSSGISLDVTANHAIASLVPLTVAVGQAGISDGEMTFVDRHNGCKLATLRLRRAAAAPAADLELSQDCSFLEVIGGRHACLPAGLRSWQRLLQARWRHDAGFRMSNRAIQLLALYYICPRPVVLVSVDDGTNSNLFPMDLIGGVRDRFTLALRNTSPSVATMRGSRRVALADVGLRLLRTVYDLGKHHRVARIDWHSLPFEAMRSTEFGLAVPADAQRVREYLIESWREMGSHTFFVCRAVSDRTLGSEPRLHHTCGIHRVYRQHAGDVPWHEFGAKAGAGA